MKSEKINLEKGYILLYDFGKIKVYNYNTVDYIDDQVILLEKDNAFSIEPFTVQRISSFSL